MNVQEELVVVSKDHMTQIMKGKRTKRQRLPSPLRLAMHSSSTSCSSGSGKSSTDNSLGLDLATTTSPTNSNIDHYRIQEEEDMANCLILLAQGKLSSPSQPSPDHHNNNNKSKSGLQIYECKTCNRCFPSFQALGGHRASHKKPKATNTIGTDQEKRQALNTFVNEEDHDHNYDPTTTSTTLSLQISNNRPSLPLYRSSTTSTIATTKLSKVHECSICGAEFSSGQALGGHMRRHRTCISTNTTTTKMSMSSGNIIGGGVNHESQETKKPRNVLKLDLNLPAVPDDDHRESKFSFQTRENVIVFSAPSLVDCHY